MTITLGFLGTLVSASSQVHPSIIYLPTHLILLTILILPFNSSNLTPQCIANNQESILWRLRNYGVEHKIHSRFSARLTR
ncbi:hypothetical protein EYC84_008247 [Monilinia fructicola]|uniref:Uncharacterized protein n=1 Tax=Monilinia fructicola TaxID=38448 RepID=A0A5M9JEI8_MONFR|nr:hypothetical protein EYC84_008247 [Monilinia fructicola]